MFNYFEISKIVDWIKSLNEGNDLVAIARIKPVPSLYSRIFLRGQPLDSLATATIITEDFNIFVGKLNAFTEGHSFDYSTCQDPGTNLPTIVYLYNTKKAYKGRVVPFKIKVMTSKHFFLRKASKSEQSAKTKRLQQFCSCKKIYEENDYQMIQVV